MPAWIAALRPRGNGLGLLSGVTEMTETRRYYLVDARRMIKKPEAGHNAYISHFRRKIFPFGSPYEIKKSEEEALSDARWWAKQIAAESSEVIIQRWGDDVGRAEFYKHSDQLFEEDWP